MTQPTGQPDTVMDPTSISIATVYADALLGQLPSNPEAAEVAEELDAIVELLDGIDGFEALLTAALINGDQRCELVRRIFHDRVSEVVEATLVVMADAGRLGVLRTLRRLFHSKLNARLGKVEVSVVSAVALSDQQRECVREALAESLKTEPVLTCLVDPELLGGVVVRVGDQVFDASIRAELKTVQSRLRRDVQLDLEKLTDQSDEAT